MALSDCVKCWETPCQCGHEWTEEGLISAIKLHTELLERKLVLPALPLEERMEKSELVADLKRALLVYLGRVTERMLVWRTGVPTEPGDYRVRGDYSVDSGARSGLYKAGFVTVYMDVGKNLHIRLNAVDQGMPLEQGMFAGVQWCGPLPRPRPWS